MEFAIGVAAATAVGLFATVIGFDKERSCYPDYIGRRDNWEWPKDEETA